LPGKNLVMVTAMQKKKPNDASEARAKTRTGRDKMPEVDLAEFRRLLQSRKVNKVYREDTAQAYSYIYGPEVQDKKFSKDLSLIENRLTDLGLNGKIHRLTKFKNIKEIIADDVRGGAKTLVIFGNDETVLKTLTAIPAAGLTVGVVPFGEPQTIAKMLGLVDRFAACQALSARLLRPIDLGKINDQFFFGSVRFPHSQARIACDGQYSVEAAEDRDLEIFNLHLPKDEDDKLFFKPNPHDGHLELVVRKFNKLSIFGGWRYALNHAGRDSVFLFRKAEIQSKTPVNIILDGRKTSVQNPKIGVIKGALKLIVGKNRRI